MFQSERPPRCRAIDAFDAYFHIPYPLPKLDLIAVPDFSTIAMENWGALVFRDDVLLVDETTTSTLR